MTTSTAKLARRGRPPFVTDRGDGAYIVNVRGESHKFRVSERGDTSFLRHVSGPQTEDREYARAIVLKHLGN